jgi:transcriptional regulator with XRE-family HTH domain
MSGLVGAGDSNSNVGKHKRSVQNRVVMMTGPELKAWRVSRGWSQERLMAEFGMSSRQTIASYERASTVPRLVELAVLAIDHISGAVDLIGKPNRKSRQKVSHKGLPYHQVAEVAFNQEYSEKYSRITTVSSNLIPNAANRLIGAQMNS